MAGVAFSLRLLANQRNIFGTFAAVGVSTLLSSGAWIFTILMVFALTLLAQAFLDFQASTVFSAIVSYNFGFTLVLTGPLAALLTRYLSNKIYENDTSSCLSILVLSIAVFFVLTVLPITYFYGFFLELNPLQRYFAFSTFYLVAAIWICNVFVSALKNYIAVVFSFCFGSLIAILISFLLTPILRSNAIYLGIVLGLSTVLIGLLSAIFEEYSSQWLKPKIQTNNLIKYWPLLVTGFFYNAGLWVDKWVLWLMDPNSTWVAGGIVVLVPYDMSMFLAHLSIIPFVAYFFLHIEPKFFVATKSFYDSMRFKSVLDDIDKRHLSLLVVVRRSLRELVFIGFILMLIFQFLMPKMLILLGDRYELLAITRVALLGSYFHALAFFVMTFLNYFDLKKHVAMLSILFFSMNAIMTAVTGYLGYSWYGYGYFFSTLFVFLISLVILIREVNWLKYSCLIGNNIESLEVKNK